MAIERYSSLIEAMQYSKLEVGVGRRINRHFLTNIKKITTVLADEYLIKAKAINDSLTPELVRYKLLIELEDIYTKINEQQQQQQQEELSLSSFSSSPSNATNTTNNTD